MIVISTYCYYAMHRGHRGSPKFNIITLMPFPLCEFRGIYQAKKNDDDL